MKTQLLYCGMIEREILAAMQQCGVSYPARRIEEGLHNTPAKLTERLQEELDRVDADTERVLLGFAFCGNALADVTTGDYELIVPRADDCITLLLGSHKRRLEIQREANSYFLTEGWLSGDLSIWGEYRHAVQRYGEETAQEIFEEMLRNYRRLLVIDSGVSDMEKLLPQTQHVANTLSLRHEVAEGTLSMLKRLLVGPWDEKEFLKIPPRTKISACDLMLPQTE